MDPLVLNLQVDNAQAINSINAFFDIYEKGVDGMSQALSSALGKDVEVGVKLRVEGDKIIAEGVEKIDKSVQKAEASAKLMNKEFGKTPNELREQLAILKALQGDTKKYAADGKTVTKEWETVERMLKEVLARIKEMTGTDIGLEDQLINSQIAADSLMGAFNMLLGAIKSFVSTGAEMEVLFLQLKGFTGGTEQAAAAYQRFVEIGQKTPFTAKEVASAARTMMGFGIETSTASDQVERLAIVAAATGGELTHMARNMGQIQANQKAYTRDLMQFANQGIPIYQKMAEILGVGTDEIRKMTEEGQVGFGLVSAALRDMTKEGSAFQQIAEDMDNTWSAKMEAMVSAVENFAGSTLALFSAMDEAMGGLISGTLQTVIDGINSLSESFQAATAKIQEMAPIVASLTAGFAALTAMTIAANWAQFSGALGELAKMLRINVIWEKVWNATKAFGLVLAGQWHTVLLAMAVGAGAAAIATRSLAEAEKEVAEGADTATTAVQGQADALDDAMWQTQGVTGFTKEYVAAMKEVYDQSKENMDIAKTKGKMAMDWIKQEYDLAMDSIRERRQAERDSYKDFMDSNKQKQQAAREFYDSLIKGEMDALAAMRERHAEEMGTLDQKSAAERQLDALRRKELQTKLASLAVGTKEWLQTKVQIEQMDKRNKREELRKRHKQEVAAAEQKIKTLENQKSGALDGLKEEKTVRDGLHRERMDNLQEQEDMEKAKLHEATRAFQDFSATVSREQFQTHQEAMSYLDDQIQKYHEMEKAAVKAYNAASKAIAKQQESKDANAIQAAGNAVANQGSSMPTFFTGGPMHKGMTAQVNELGKEAFLSASGRLSMIKAPAFGKWTAPEAGTVIPAHLTRKLDIPAGGVNLNAGAGGVGVATAARATSGVGGDIFNQSVTVQAANPVQAANNMMVEMTRLRRRRFR